MKTSDYVDVERPFGTFHFTWYNDVRDICLEVVCVCIFYLAQ